MLLYCSLSASREPQGCPLHRAPVQCSIMGSYPQHLGVLSHPAPHWTTSYPSLIQLPRVDYSQQISDLHTQSPTSPLGVLTGLCCQVPGNELLGSTSCSEQPSAAFHYLPLNCSAPFFKALPPPCASIWAGLSGPKLLLNLCSPV